MSPFPYVLPLVIWVGTLIVCVLCVYVSWRSLFGDRGKGRRRCPKCWYDMAYSPGMTCGECGRTARSEQEFTRTRRRPFVAVSAIVICVALVIGVNDQMNQRGMLRHVPTSVLLWVLPAAGGMDGAVGREIDRRATSTQLTASQWQRLIERCAKGDWLSSPPSSSWVSNYGRFIGNWRNRFIGDAKMEQPLLTIPPLVDAKTRDTWPTGVPIMVAVRVEDWWPAGMECRVRATMREYGTHAATASAIPAMTFYRGAETRFRPSPYPMYLAPLEAGDHEIVLDFQVDRRLAAAFARSSVTSASSSSPDQSLAEDEAADSEDNGLAWEPVGTFSTTLKVHIEGTLAEMSQPISNDVLNGQMAQVFGNAVRWTGGGRSPVRFGINAPATFTPEFNDVAVGVRVELERDGEVARRLNLWWIAGDNVPDGGRNYGFEIALENLDLLRQLQDDTLEQDGWELRVTGDPMLALRAGGAKFFWRGEFTTPVNLRVSQNIAPPRMWWTEGETEKRAVDRSE